MKTFLRKKSFVIVFVVSAVCLLLLLYPDGSFFKGSVVVPEQAINGLPLRLKIPSIEVDAVIESVGITPDGAMDVPKRPDNVGLFSLGPYPGENGSSVIAGHRSWKNGKAAVFDNLDKLRKGDKLYIEDGKGKSVSFVVREIRVYDKDANVPEVFGSDNGIHLNLITCIGDWNASQKTSAERLVVFADVVH